MSSKKITVEVQTPKRQADFAHDVHMPRECSDAAAMVIGEGIRDGARLIDGRKKYARLRQILLDEMAQSVATNQRFRDVTDKR